MPLLSGRTAAPAQQFYVEGRAARRIGRQCRRCRAGDTPPGLRRTGHGISCNVQTECRHARRLGREHQAACRRQVKAVGCAPCFEQYATQSRTTHGIGGGAQHLRLVGCHHQQQRLSVQPQFDQTMRMDQSRAPYTCLGTQPQDGEGICRRGKRNRKSRARRCVILIGIHLMQPTTRKSAAEPGIRVCG